MDLTTSYLGLKLRNPVISGASPLSFSPEMALRIEEAGAGAIVLHSLFEEQLDSHATDADPIPYHFSHEQYVQHIRRLKKELKIPVIASLNSVREGAWVRHAQHMQDAGADAIELNLYYLPRSDWDSSSVVEQRAFQIVRLVRQFVSIPIAVKLSPAITSLPHLARRLEEAGANGLVLFNHFIQPDLDVNTLRTVPRLRMTSSDDLLLRLHWLAALYGRVRLDLSAIGGVHEPEDAIKALMAGAASVQTVSAVLKHGVGRIGELVAGIEKWLGEKGFENIAQARDKVDAMRRDAKKAAGRENYIRIIHNWGHDRA